MKARVFAVALSVACVAMSISADGLLHGDVVLGIQYGAALCPTPPSVVLFSPDLQRKNTLYAGSAVAVDAYGHIYALENDLPPWFPDFVGTKLDVFDTSLNRMRTIALPENARSLAVDDTGTAYVLAESGTMRVYSPAGDLVRAFVLPDVSAAPAPASLDISADRCTLVYLGADGAAHRFDACRQTALPWIGSAFDSVRALADGGVVGTTAGRIRIYDRIGSLIADYPSPTKEPVAALAFGADGTSLWIGSHMQLFRVRFADGATTGQTGLTGEIPRFLAVFGESRPPATAALPSRRRSSRH